MKKLTGHSYDGIGGLHLPWKTPLLRAFLIMGTLCCVFLWEVSHAGRNSQANASEYLVYHQRGSSSEPQFAPNSKEQTIADFMRQNPGQQRRLLRCDPILSQIAQKRAEDMGRRGYFGHTNPEGLGANHLVQQAGYQLPSFYGQSPSANNIETISAGHSTPEAVWNGWMNSTGHRTHLLGLDRFYVEQTDYGIGYAYLPGSSHTHYWVIITGRH